MRTDELAMYEAIGELVGRALALALIVAGIIAIVRHNAKVRAAKSGASTPAGWYPDPEVPQQLRYWDGLTWTEHRAPQPPG